MAAGVFFLPTVALPIDDCAGSIGDAFGNLCSYIPAGLLQCFLHICLVYVGSDFVDFCVRHLVRADKLLNHILLLEAYLAFFSYVSLHLRK